MRPHIEIPDYLYKNSNDSKFPLRFVVHDGYMALPNVIYPFHPGSNPLFGGIVNCSVSARLHNKLSIGGGSRNFRYRKTRSWHGPRASVFSGYFSVIASPEDFNYMPSDIFKNHHEIDYRMVGMVDVFCLGIVKITDLPNVTSINPKTYYVRKKPRTSITTKINKESMKIIVSKEKLRRTTFTTDNYTKTFRTAIIHELERAKRMWGITIEDVPDDYIQEFLRQPHAYATSSITETMQIDSQIKEEVFSKLNKLAV